MMCERVPMTSVVRCFAISEASRGSSYGASVHCPSPFHEIPSFLKLRDLHFSSRNNGSIFSGSCQLCFDLVTTAETTQHDLNSLSQDDDQKNLDMESLASSKDHTKSYSLPFRYLHLKELLSQLCAGVDVPSAMDPWIHKLTLSDWNQLLIQCGRKDYDIAKQIMMLFKEKEAVLDQSILLSKRNNEEALSGTASEELAREDDTSSSKDVLEDESEAFQGAPLKDNQDGLIMELSEGAQTETGSRKYELEQCSKGISPSLRLYTTLVRILTRKGNFQEIDILKREVNEAGLKLNVHYYNVLLDSYLERRMLPKSFEIFRHMKSLGYEPHIHVHEKLAHLYMNNKDVDIEVLKEFAEDLKSRSPIVSLSLYRCMLKAQWEAKDVAGAEEAFEALLATGYTPDMKDLLKVMQLNGRRGNHERVVELVELMVKLGCKPRASVYDYLIHAYCKSGFLEKAKETLVKYELVLGIKPTPIAINMLIDGYGKQGLYEEALEIFEGIRDYGYWPTAVSYSSIISAMAQVGKFQTAAQLYERMLRAGIQPNLHTYLTLIRLYTKCNQTREGHKIYTELRRAPYELTATAYSVCLALYVDGCWYHHAAALMKEIEEKGVILDAIAHSSLIRSFSILESKTTPLARAVQESEMEICKLLASLFHATSEKQTLECSLREAVFLILEKWKEVASIEAKALVYNTFIDYFWRKGYKEIAEEILEMGRDVYAGYSKPRLVDADWVLDVRGLGVGGAKAALKDFLFSEEEVLEDKGGDDTKMVIITGDEFSLSLTQDNIMVKTAISSMLTDLGSPFAESPNRSESLEATLGNILKWASEVRFRKPRSLF